MQLKSMKILDKYSILSTRLRQKCLNNLKEMLGNS